MGQEFGLRVEPEPSEARGQLAGSLGCLLQRDENASLHQLGYDALTVQQDNSFVTGLRLLIDRRFREPGERYKIEGDPDSLVLALLCPELPSKSIQLLAAHRLVEGLALGQGKASFQAVFRLNVNFSSATRDVQADMVVPQRHKEIAH